MNEYEKIGISLELEKLGNKIIEEFEDEVKNILVKNASKSRGYMYLDHLLSILGWQGGTIHQVLIEVKRLKQFENDHKIPKEYEKDFFLQVLDALGLSDCQTIVNYERAIEKIKRLKNTSDNLEKAILILQETRKGKLGDLIEGENGSKNRT